MQLDAKNMDISSVIEKALVDMVSEEIRSTIDVSALVKGYIDKKLQTEKPTADENSRYMTEDEIDPILAEKDEVSDYLRKEIGLESLYEKGTLEEQQEAHLKEYHTYGSIERKLEYDVSGREMINPSPISILAPNEPAQPRAIDSSDFSFVLHQQIPPEPATPPVQPSQPALPKPATPPPSVAKPQNPDSKYTPVTEERWQGAKLSKNNPIFKTDIDWTQCVNTECSCDCFVRNTGRVGNMHFLDNEHNPPKCTIGNHFCYSKKCDICDCRTLYCKVSEVPPLEVEYADETEKLASDPEEKLKKQITRQELFDKMAERRANLRNHISDSIEDGN